MSWVCSSCQAVREKPEKRLPSGWKRRAEEVLCDTCWSKRYILRAIAIPIAFPVECDWQELRSALNECWKATTQASNWMMTELYTRDARPTGQERMPPMARIYLYPETRARFPQLPSQTCAALEQAVQKKYRAARYKLIWTSQVSLPMYRYPTPFPVPNQGWAVAIQEERVVVSTRIGEKRYQFRLRGGPGFRRQRKSIESIISGEAVQGELALYQQNKDIMVKMVAWLPRHANAQRQRDQRSGTLSVRTDADSLLAGLNAKGEKVWMYHGDQILRWSAEHRKQLRRWSDDSGAEQRRVSSFADRRAAATRKYYNRMSTAAKEVAAMLTGYAARHKFAIVRYDDSNTSYCEGFPWFALRERIKTNLDELRIEFEQVSVEAAPEVAQPLADDVTT